MYAALTETQLLLLTLMLEYDSDDARCSTVRLTSLDAGVCRGDPARSQISDPDLRPGTLCLRSTTGRRAFYFAGPHVWNSLPEHIRQSTSSALTKDISTPADIAPSPLETMIFYCFMGYINTRSALRSGTSASTDENGQVDVWR